ncbi:MAG: 2-hydroxyacid dehydrogenase, partial [Methyloligellaceae bacterium]
LGVIDVHRAWADDQQIELIGDPSLKNLSDKQIGLLFAGVHAVILPAPFCFEDRHMAGAETLQVVSIAASGYEWMDIEAATRHGIVVTHAPVREGAEVVADLTWGLILGAARRIPYHDRAVRNGEYARTMGTGVFNKTLGIVGLGNIGKAVVRRAIGFGMQILATDPKPDKEFVRQYSVKLVTLTQLLAQSDFVSLHVRLSAQTEGMIGSRELALMKRQAYLINTARGGLVNEAALYSALTSGQLAGAAMDDVPSKKDVPLLKCDDFICTPHLGNFATEGVNAVFRCALENALAVVQGRRPRAVLNPEVYDGRLRTVPACADEK